MVLISRLPRCIAGTSVPWRKSELAKCSCTSNSGAAFSSSLLKSCMERDRKSGGGAAVEKRSTSFCCAAAGIAAKTSESRTSRQRMDLSPFGWAGRKLSLGGLQLRHGERKDLQTVV